MHYECSIDIDLSRDRVIELFDDENNLRHWQEGLQSFEHVSGERGTPGAVSRIRFKTGRGEMEMLETIEARDMPERFIAVYTTKGVWNRNENYFEDLGQKTRWLQKNEFRCDGLFMKLMTTLMPGMFRKSSLKYMKAFKAFAENA